MVGALSGGETAHEVFHGCRRQGIDNRVEGGHGRGKERHHGESHQSGR